MALGWSLYGGDSRRLSHNLRAVELLRQVGGEPALLGQALTQAGTSTKGYRNIAEAGQYLDEAVSILRRSSRTKRLAVALLNAGSSRRRAGELNVAGAFINEALALSVALGDIRVRDHCEAQLAMIAFAAGQMPEAIDRARRAVEASRRHGTLIAEFQAVHWLAGFLVLDDQIEPGRAAALKAFELSRTLGDVDLPGLIYQIALVLVADGKAGIAAHLVGFADGHADEHQLSGLSTVRAIRSRLTERLYSALGPNECQIAMAAGAAWSEREAIAAAEAA